jgi:hypothetical protein
MLNLRRSQRNEAEEKNMMINPLFKKALILGSSIIAVGVVARATYDPPVELFPGRIIPLSQAKKTVAVWDTAGAGREAKWINPDPELRTYPDPMFSADRTGRYH